MNVRIKKDNVFGKIVGKFVQIIYEIKLAPTYLNI